MIGAFLNDLKNRGKTNQFMQQRVNDSKYLNSIQALCSILFMFNDILQMQEETLKLKKYYRIYKTHPIENLMFNSLVRVSVFRRFL